MTKSKERPITNKDIAVLFVVLFTSIIEWFWFQTMLTYLKGIDTNEFIVWAWNGLGVAVPAVLFCIGIMYLLDQWSVFN